MNLRTVIATATTAAVLATAGVAIAGAATDTSSSAPNSGSPAVVVTTTSTKPATPAAHPLRHRVRVRRAIRRGAAKVVIQTVGIDRKTLRADLLSGETIADIATAHSVAPQTVIDALVTAATKKVEAAEQKGLITSAREARIEKRLPGLARKFLNTWLPKKARTTTTAS